MTRNARRMPWLDPLVLPAVAVLGMVIGYPVVYTLLLSGEKFNLLDTTPARFIGSANYARFAVDPIFWLSLGNTAIYTFGSVAIAARPGPRPRPAHRESAALALPRHPRIAADALGRALRRRRFPVSLSCISRTAASSTPCCCGWD